VGRNVVLEQISMNNIENNNYGDILFYFTDAINSHLHTTLFPGPHRPFVVAPQNPNFMFYDCYCDSVYEGNWDRSTSL
jgi:hypothetical protein